MTKESSSTAGGIGFGGLLLLAFIILKLCGIITWSWWWVLSPLWIPLAIGVFIFILWIIFQIAKK